MPRSDFFTGRRDTSVFQGRTTCKVAMIWGEPDSKRRARKLACTLHLYRKLSKNIFSHPELPEVPSVGIQDACGLYPDRLYTDRSDAR